MPRIDTPTELFSSETAGSLRRAVRACQAVGIFPDQAAKRPKNIARKKRASRVRIPQECQVVIGTARTTSSDGLVEPSCGSTVRVRLDAAEAAERSGTSSVPLDASSNP